MGTQKKAIMKIIAAQALFESTIVLKVSCSTTELRARFQD